jgi:hypothetical protein
VDSIRQEPAKIKRLADGYPAWVRSLFAEHEGLTLLKSRPSMWTYGDPRKAGQPKRTSVSARPVAAFLSSRGHQLRHSHSWSLI